ncbi:hypothetical protein ILUMI_17964 [Ignelater luminosus]|uniref:PiggyBac transposable element-derived protein domain-containing protein n=1 Tax=Ignelater luminosus TaxID=2038154 RepID=A0A8K0G1D4_IGNLU|nr:hypothetical protein ILUMI_17964 [Ignelater luminosus]
MSQQRFRFLLRCLRFDINTYQERREVDRLAPIRKLFKNLDSNCRRWYIVGKCLTIDEMLEVFRGRCGFRQFIKSKSVRYGIKIFAVVDSEARYTVNLKVYLGKQPNGQFEMSNSPWGVVKRLNTTFSGSGRNITMDN